LMGKPVPADLEAAGGVSQLRLHPLFEGGVSSDEGT